MSDSERDTGTIQALLERFEKFRLPRVLALEKRVDEGERLSADDLEFLKRMLDEIREIAPMIERHREFRSLAARLANLYDKITARALENEKRV
jgi:hypothetical protein